MAAGTLVAGRAPAAVSGAAAGRTALAVSGAAARAATLAVVEVCGNGLMVALF